ncbi:MULTISPECIES: multidrug efflux SMR transporter [Lysinibacillus]|uniref:Ligand-binding protein SH3 n=1 Tax=Lysinibacillus boronitolerans JCM 21713 = 10a = NBRC 103108 TaxID=1294264 RepID=A0ABR4Y242_9BACI|nr:multidrug efflux SMR transporter [Lysinibacillus boronitolerans]KGR86570.1 ligand-binding protein SH3 [Lysinibacillus boronitolerans JCM 21713 = 10a = NBRC 103108]MCS1392674.1 multidrug efflux SMR transporter [Lysinibacillus boronitolerans]
MAWFYLILGGIFEVGWALGLKYSDGFTNISVLIPTLLLLVLSFWCFSKTLVTLPVSTAYAVFTGLGAFGTAVVGMTLLGDPVSFTKVVLVFILISCIIGLKIVSNETETESGE